MTTTNLGLDNSLTQLTEGQEQKEAAINSNTTKLLANMDALDSSVPLFMGEFPSAPISGTAALGSTYFNTDDSKLYILRSKSPDVYYTGGDSGGSVPEWGSIGGTLSDQTDLQNALDSKATVNQGSLADTAIQPGANVSDLVNDAGYLTSVPPSSGGSSLVEKKFKPIAVDAFGKNNTTPMDGISSLAIWNTTSHCPNNNKIVNVYNSGLNDTNTLTFFDVVNGQAVVKSSENTTITGGQVRWVDFSVDGDRVAVTMNNQTIIILVTSTDWDSYTIEQTIVTTTTPNEQCTSATLDSDGSVLWFAIGNDSDGSGATPKVGYYTRSGSTWSFTENAFTGTAGESHMVLLMHGQQDVNTVGFQLHNTNNNGIVSHHVYQKSGTWSQVWSTGSANISDGNSEADIIACISFDGDTVFYRTSGDSAELTVNVLSSQNIVGIFEGLDGGDAPFVMSSDGKNVAYVTSSFSGGRIWFHYLEGTNMEEIGFGSFNYEINRPYGPQQHNMRPSKSGHYYMIGTNSGNYVDDAIFAGIEAGQYISKANGISY